MALSARELYLVLRARDEASRVLRGFGREILNLGATAARAQAEFNLATARQTMAYMKAQGASAAMLAGQQAIINAHKDELEELKKATAKRQQYAQVLSQTGQTLETVGLGIATAGLLTLGFLNKAVTASNEYERQVKMTKTQVDGFSASLEDLSRVGLGVANTVGVAFDQIQPALYDIFSSTNANLKQGEILLTAFAKAAVAGQSDIQTASKGTISIMNAFNIPLEKVNDVLDIQFQTVRKGRMTYTEFGNVIGNIIPSATRAGQSFETVGAMLAFMTRNGLSAAMAATSGARALEAMSNPKAIAKMEEMGIKVRDANGHMLPLNQTLEQLRDKLNALPAADRVKALLDIFKGAGGTIQARRFLEQVLLRPGELEEFEGYLKDMQNASGAFGAAYNEMADSAATKSQLLANRWETLKVLIGNALRPYLLQLVDALSKVLEWFNNLPQGTQNLIAKFLLFGAVMATVVGGGTILIGLLAGVAAAVMAAGSTFFLVSGIVTGVVVGIGLFAAALVVAYNKSSGFRDMLHQVWDAMSAFYDAAIQFAMGIKQAWDEHMSQPLSKLWNIINNQVMPALTTLAAKVQSEVMPKVQEAGRILIGVFGWALQQVGGMINNIVVPALKWMVEWWNRNKSTIEPLFPVLAQVVKWFLIIAGIVVGVLVAAFVGPLVGGVLAVIAVVFGAIAAFRYFWGAIGTVIGWVKQFIGWLNNMVSAGFAASSGMQAFASRLPGMIRDAVGNLGGLLLNAGKQVVQGLINGIESMIGSLKDKLGFLTSLIPDHKGPIEKDRKLLRPAGQAIMTGLMQGLEDKFPQLVGMLGDISDNLSLNIAPGVPGGGYTPSTGAVDGMAVVKYITNDIDVHTQEIDPKQQSADLGWELAGRM